MIDNTKANELLKLHKSIEKINQDRIRREAQRDSLLQTLMDKMTEYANKYNVSIEANTLEEAMAFAKHESERVSREQEAEVQLKSKLVKMHEQGDIEGMRELLGLENETTDFVIKVDKAEQSTEPEPVKTIEPKTVKTVQPVEPVQTKQEPEDIDFDFDDEVVVETKPTNTTTDDDDFDMDLDLDFLDFDY